MFISVEIYRFFCSFMILCFDISFKRLEIDHLLKYWNVTFCDVFLIMWLTLDNRKRLPTYIQEKGKFHSSYHIWHVGLTCSQDHYLFDWTPCVASLSFLFSDTLYSGNINYWRSYYGNIFLLGWYVSCACELFSVNLILFAIKNFYEQL